VGLLFLAPTLEQRWGGRRMLRFIIGSALIAYAVQMVAELLLPASVGAKLVGPYWFGALPVIEAIAIAWALSFRGQTVRLFFVLPVTSAVLIWVVIGISVLHVIAGTPSPEGLIAPFGGMFAGWLLGAGTPSPARKIYLRLRLAQLDREAAHTRQHRAKRVQKSNLRVIEGGRDDDDDHGPGGQLLN
jgi:membrane associated rhomboid family serine protease